MNDLPFEWIPGEVVEQAYVEIGGVKYYVTPTQYADGTSLSAYHLNRSEYETIKRVNETFGYNLITNGEAVKTGRKINGYTEYVKRISATVQAGTNRTVSTGLTNGTHEIVNYHGVISNFNGTGTKVRDGFYNGGNNYFSIHAQGASTFYIILGSDTPWVSGSNLYIDIYYIDLTEVVE